MSAYDETRMQINRRQSLRMGVADPDENVVLCDGFKRSPVRVIDVSTGGFGVEAGSDVTFLLDQKIQLETDNWIHDVRVVYVNKCDDVNRIGLERLGENPFSGTRIFMRKVRSSGNIRNTLLNYVRGIFRIFKPETWQGSASFFTTLAICFLIIMAAYLVKNGALGGNRNSWKNSSVIRAVKVPRGSSRTTFSTSPTAYQSWETGRSPNSLGQRLRISWLDLRMVFKPGDILYEVMTRTVIYNNARPEPPGMPGELGHFNQKMQLYWNQLKEQIRSAEEILRNQQANSGPKTQAAGITSDSSATTTGSNPDTPDGTVDGTLNNQQRNNPPPTPVTPSQGADPSRNTGGVSSSTNSTDQNGSATP